ncbi:hypothetical protein D1872_51910 [compost metagenome]
MSVLVVKCGNKIVYERQEVQSRWTGELEESRQEFVAKSSRWVSAALGVVYSYKLAGSVSAAAAAITSAEKIRQGFMQIIDVFTAIAEPILWFYAVTACILMATGKNKDMGWDRLKRVGYAYIFIAMLPTFFSFLRWIAEMLRGAIGGLT